MNKRWVLRIISLCMLAAALIFVGCALSCPTCGSAFYIGPFRIGAKVWRAFYLFYLLVMAGLFGASFFVDRK